MSDAIPDVTLNAWAGDGAGPVRSDLSQGLRWALRQQVDATPSFLAPRVVDLRNWRDPAVGWGLVLADGVAIPPDLERLRQHRGNAPVFRYRPGSKYAYTVLRNYEAQKDVDVNASPKGTAAGALPYYLLIYGSPEAVPWRLQYILNTNRCVGRLDLDATGLSRYVTALIDRWEDGEATRGGVRARETLVWSVVHEGGDSPDITVLMRDSVATPVLSRMRDDPDIGARAQMLDGGAATAARLTEAVVDHQPGLVVTTSHGQTGPLSDRDAMASRLGVLVDQEYAAVPEPELASRTRVDGTVWYAHACCSAGSDAESSFAHLFDEATTAGTVLRAVASLGSRTGPLPRALLGSAVPIRAFIGHVEPTFDWTLRQPFSGQHLTSALVRALYDEMFRADDLPTPIGHCFREWFSLTGGLLIKSQEARAAFNRGDDNRDLLLWYQLAARDVVSTVILGDPALPLPPAG